MEDEEYDFHFPTQCDNGRVTRLEALIHTLLAGFFQILPKISKLQLGTFEESMPSGNETYNFQKWHFFNMHKIRN